MWCRGRERNKFGPISKKCICEQKWRSPAVLGWIVSFIRVLCLPLQIRAAARIMIALHREGKLVDDTEVGRTSSDTFVTRYGNPR